MNDPVVDVTVALDVFIQPRWTGHAVRLQLLDYFFIGRNDGGEFGSQELLALQV